MSTNDRISLEILGKAVRQRRQALGMSIEKAAFAGPMSAVTWGRVEKGLPIRGLGYAAVDRVLMWPSGKCKEILEGQVPTLKVGDKVTKEGESNRLIGEIHQICSHGTDYLVYWWIGIDNSSDAWSATIERKEDLKPYGFTAIGAGLSIDA